MAIQIGFYKLQNGFRLQDGDIIRATVDAGTPGQVTWGITLGPKLSWTKGIDWIDTDDLHFPGTRVWGEENRGPNFTSILDIPEVLVNAKVLLGKPKFFGVYTGMYTVGPLHEFIGKTVLLDWVWDFGGTPPSDV